MSGALIRHNESEMYRETPISRLSTMRETGVSRDIFTGEHGFSECIIIDLKKLLNQFLLFKIDHHHLHDRFQNHIFKNRLI